MESFPGEGVQSPSVAEDPALGLSPRAKLEILGAVLLGLLLLVSHRAAATAVER